MKVNLTQLREFIIQFLNPVCPKCCSEITWYQHDSEVISKVIRNM